MRFRKKERGTRVKDREKSGASKRARRGWGRKEGNVGFQNRGVCLQAFPSFPSPSPLFYFLALVSFLARSIPKVPFFGISLLRNQTETLATQATLIKVLFFSYQMQRQDFLHIRQNCVAVCCCEATPLPTSPNRTQVLKTI